VRAAGGMRHNITPMGATANLPFHIDLFYIFAFDVPESSPHINF